MENTEKDMASRDQNNKYEVDILSRLTEITKNKVVPADNVPIKSAKDKKDD